MSTAQQIALLGGAMPNGSLLWKWSVNAYADLAAIPNPQDGEVAKVTTSQGTAWLPGSLGGSYYPSGFYTWDAAGAAWKMDKTIEQIANALESISGGGGNFSDSWSISGIFETTSSSFGQIPEQIIIPHKEQILAGATKIEAKLLVSTENESASTGEADVFDYTDGGQVTGSVVSLPAGAWSDKISSAWFDVTAYEGSSVRARIRRVTGGGMNATRIEGATLIFKVS